MEQSAMPVMIKRAKPDVISGLPMELVSIILTLAARSEDSHPLKRAIDFTRVSRRWKELAVATRPLWTKIYVSFKSPHEAALNRYLTRAGPLPFELCFNFGPCSNTNQLITTTRSWFEVVLRHVGRLRLLDITSIHIKSFKLLAVVLKNAAAPVLEELALRYVHSPIFLVDQSVALFSGGTPSLRSYHIRGIHLLHFTPFRSVKNLCISQFVGDKDRREAAGEVVRFLGAHPALERLAIQSSCMCHEAWGRFLQQQQPIRIESLRSLVITDRGTKLRSHIGRTLQSFIYAPNLETLVLLDTSTVYDILDVHTAEQTLFSTVKTLAIIHPAVISPINFARLAVNVPSLTHLILILHPRDNFICEGIRFSERADDTFNRLFVDLCSGAHAPGSLHKSVLLPNLNTLTLHPVPIETVCKIVEQRELLGYPISKVRMQLPSLHNSSAVGDVPSQVDAALGNELYPKQLSWLRDRVQLQDIDSRDIIAEYYSLRDGWTQSKALEKTCRVGTLFCI